MRLFRRGVPPTLAGIVVFLLASGLWLAGSGGLRGGLRERTLDQLLPLVMPPTPTQPEVVIVDIDRAALARFGPWPWLRGDLARIVGAAAQGHPLVIGIDILLAGPDRFSTDGDSQLAEALGTVPSVLGFVMETAGAGVDLSTTPVLARAPVPLPGLWRAPGIIGPAPVLADAAAGYGAMVAAADPDGPIRRVPLLVMAGGAARPGLAVETVLRAREGGTLIIEPGGLLRIGDLTVRLGEDAQLRLPRLAADDRISRVIPATALLDDPALRAGLAGRIVLIGGSAPELGGLRVTAASPVTPSVRIQAEAIVTLLRGGSPVRPGVADLVETSGAVVLAVLGLILAAGLRPVPAAGLMAVLALGWSVGAVAAAPMGSALIDPVGPPGLAVLGFVAAALARFARDEWRARLLRLSFEQHLAPEVVRRIAADPGALRLRGEMREITALFTDIEGFTSMTERAGPVDLVALLDMYFEATVRVITDQGGMIDKIVGDAIHAIFNAPFSLPDHPARAVAAAQGLLEASETIRRSPLGQRLQLGRTRVGIETGQAIVGDVGGGRKLDYTAHGNAMNAAARLEAANKEFGSSICIGPGAAERLDPASLRPIGVLIPRGQSREITVYTPASMPLPPPVTPPR